MRILFLIFIFLALLIHLDSESMALRFNRHNNPDQINQELKNIDFIKEERIIFADRAPSKSEGGRLWLDYEAGTLYFRHPNSGVWTAL